MARPGSETLNIDRPDQIAALTSPVRQEIIDVTSVAGPCSVADLGRILGRAPDSLYYHVRKLLSVGLLQEVGTRGRGEAEYDTPARRMRVVHDATDAEGLGQVLATAKAGLRTAQRELERSLSTGPSGVPPHKHTGMGRFKAWLTDDELAEVNRLIDAIAEVYYGAEPRADTRLHSLTYAFAQIEPSARARRSASSPVSRK